MEFLKIAPHRVLHALLLVAIWMGLLCPASSFTNEGISREAMALHERTQASSSLSGKPFAATVFDEEMLLDSTRMLEKENKQEGRRKKDDEEEDEESKEEKENNDKEEEEKKEKKRKDDKEEEEEENKEEETQDGEEKEEDAMETLSDCELEFGSQKRLYRDEFAEFILDTVTAELIDYSEEFDLDVTALKTFVSEPDGDADYLPTFDSLPRSTLTIFSSYACEYRRDKDKEVRQYCEDDDSSVRDLPSEALISAGKVGNENKYKKVVANICADVAEDWEKIIDAVIEHYEKEGLLISFSESESSSTKEDSTSIEEDPTTTEWGSTSTEEDSTSNKEESYSQLNMECQSEMNNLESKLTRDMFSNFVFSITANDLPEELQSLVLDSNKEIIEEHLPAFHLLPNDVFQTFIAYACAYNDADDEDTAVYCKAKERTGNVPESARIPFAQFQSKEKSIISIELCKVIEKEWSIIVENAAEHYRYFSIEEGLTTGGSTNEKIELADIVVVDTAPVYSDQTTPSEPVIENSSSWMAIPVSFSIRVIDNTVLPNTNAMSMMKELERLVNLELSFSDAENRYLSEGNGKEAELVGIEIQTMRLTDCKPEKAEEFCYDVLAIIKVDPNEQNHTELEERIIRSIRKDQSDKAYFAYLQGFRGIPASFSSLENKVDYDQDGITTTSLIAFILGCIAFLATIGMFTYFAFRRRLKEDNWKKSMTDEELAKKLNSYQSEKGGAGSIASADSSIFKKIKVRVFPSSDSARKNGRGFMASMFSNSPPSGSTHAADSDIEMVLDDKKRKKRGNKKEEQKNEVANKSPSKGNNKGKWESVMDETSGDTYYYHTVTNETTWDKPASLL